MYLIFSYGRRLMYRWCLIFHLLSQCLQLPRESWWWHNLQVCSIYLHVILSSQNDRNDCQLKGVQVCDWGHRHWNHLCVATSLPGINHLLPRSEIYLLSANYNLNRLLSYSIQARDLEVNGGVWRGETTDVGYDTFPNGWGVLQYNEADHLNRFEFT